MPLFVAFTRGFFSHVRSAQGGIPFAPFCIAPELRQRLVTLFRIKSNDSAHFDVRQEASHPAIDSALADRISGGELLFCDEFH